MSNRLTAIKQRLARLPLTQKALAEAAGLDETTISRTLLEHTDPLNSTLDKIEAVVASAEDELRQALMQGAA